MSVREDHRRQLECIPRDDHDNLHAGNCDVHPPRQFTRAVSRRKIDEVSAHCDAPAFQTAQPGI